MNLPSEKKLIEALQTVMREARAEGRPINSRKQGKDISVLYDRTIVWLQNRYCLSDEYVAAKQPSGYGKLRQAVNGCLNRHRTNDEVFPIRPDGTFDPDYAGYVPRATSTNTPPDTNTKPIEAALVEVSTAVDMLAGALKELAEAITTHTHP